MKKIIILIAAVFIGFASNAQNASLPTTQVRDMKGQKKTFNEIIEKGKVNVVSFWATWCGPCKLEIENIKNKLEAWQKESPFNFITVSQDDIRGMQKAKNYAITQKWNFPNYFDPNLDLCRSLNFQSNPYLIIVDKEGKIVERHSGYVNGSENKIFEKIKELNK